MSQSPMDGLMAQGPLPAGMLRIRQGQQERYVWPVHLPGWLGLGWRLAGAEDSAGSPSIRAGTAEPPAPIAPVAGEPLEQDDAKPASTRGRRGRPRKEKTPTAADPVAAPEQQEQEPDGDGTANGTGSKAEPAAETAAAPGADEISEPAADSDANPEVLLSDLPNDLFDDPLI